MKKLSLLLIVFIMSTLFACGGSSSGSSGGNSDSPRVPSNISINNSKALFIGNASELYARMSFFDRVHAAIFKSAYADNNSRVLYQVDEDGKVDVAPILDQNGNEIDATILGLGLVNPKIVCIGFQCSGKLYFVLADIEVGKLYDITEHFMYPTGATAYYNNISRGFNDNEIIIVKDNELRILDFQTMEYTVVNDPSVDQVVLSAIDASYQGYRYNYPVLFRDNKILARVNSGSWEYKLFDPKCIDAPIALPFDPDFCWGTDSYNSRFITKNASMCRIYITKFVTTPIGYGYYGYYQIHLLIHNSIIDLTDKVYTTFSTINNSLKLLPLQENYLPDVVDRYVIDEFGYTEVTTNTTKIEGYSWINDDAFGYKRTEKDMNFLFVLTGDLRIQGSVVYGLTNSSKIIAKADILTDNSLTTVYESPYAIVKIWFIRDTLFFTAYTMENSIATYKLTSGSATPELVDNSDLAIGPMVNLPL